MRLPIVNPFYRGLPDEFPEDENRLWRFFGYDIRIFEGERDKFFEELRDRKIERIFSGRALWQKICSVPKITPR